eukprot:1892848-Pyramimonas_sp.AAC.1
MLRALARCLPLPCRILDSVLPGLPAKKARGVDAMSPLAIQRQPARARQFFVDNPERCRGGGRLAVGDQHCAGRRRP